MSVNCWCPAGGLLERVRANGKPFSKDLALSHSREASLLNISLTRAHNDEIGRVIARGYGPPPIDRKKKSHIQRAEGIAFARVEAPRRVWDKPMYWPKAWSQGVPGTGGPLIPVSVGSTPTPSTNRLIAKHGEEAIPCDYKREEAFDSVTDGYEAFSVARSYEITYAKLYRRFSDDKVVLEYGFSGSPVKRLNWREVRIPKSFRSPRRKK